jgi:hypothetical protein
MLVFTSPSVGLSGFLFNMSSRGGSVAKANAANLHQEVYVRTWYDQWYVSMMRFTHNS